MKKNLKIATIIGIIAIVTVIALWMGRDLLLARSIEIRCDDGIRRTIDLRNFSTQYWAYSVQFEGTLKDVVKLRGKLEPQRLQELTQAQQEAQEFRKYVVAGFNSCAINKVQYARYGARFQALDAVSRQIDSLLERPTVTAEDRSLLDHLASRYSAIAQHLSEE